MKNSNKEMLVTTTTLKIIFFGIQISIPLRKTDNFLPALFLVPLLTFTQLGCKKFVQADVPFTSVNAGNVYVNDNTAASVLTGIYGAISNGNTGLITVDNITSTSFYAGLSSDELTLYNTTDGRFSPFYKNDLTAQTSSGLFWNNLYSIIFIANSAIEGLNNSNSLTPAIKKQLTGEAKFVRAFCYFYLVNLYGDVPLALTTDYKKNGLLNRSSKPTVYQQIIMDLKDAIDNLSPKYLMSDASTPYPAGAEERTRPNKYTAAALLSRVYLYTGDYANAELQATSVINSNLYTLNQLDDVFKMNSTETIWSLQPVNSGPQSNTGDGATFILPPSGPNDFNPVYLSDFLLQSFENNDQRKQKWIGNVNVNGTDYSFPYKYKIGLVDTATGENVIVFRLAEQYLIKAEAEANGAGNGTSAAIADLNLIRNRAGLGNYSGASDKASLVSAIQHERQVELFTEWGHRWFDLKRTEQINTIMSVVTPAKGGTWNPNKALYPIPQSELVADPNIVQNPGY